MTAEHFDVIIVGAGLSGIGAAYYLQAKCPHKRYAILEGRAALGGTWDLFRYPGVRSDSDMYTLGYSFRPWDSPKSIADGAAILAYLQDTAAVYGIDKHIRFQHRVVRASWSSAEACWTVEVERGPDRAPVRLTCSFLSMCSGYYEYERGYAPAWPGAEQFAGAIVHPQHWPPDLDYAGKQVVVIGSGATAVTLVPALAKQAAHVTMLQRSPTYIVAQPAEDATAAWLRRRLPRRLAHSLMRWQRIVMGIVTYSLMRWQPAVMKRQLVKMVRRQLGPTFDVARHFTPRYNPWDQRICLVPDGDLFAALTAGVASVETDHIAALTPRGIQLRSGKELPADIIVTATGLVMTLLHGVELVVDGRPAALSDSMSYKGMLFSDIPNFSLAIGYTNAAWTLKCELTHRYVCRLLRYMDRHGYVQCTPRHTAAATTTAPIIGFTSGYVQRALASLPRQGSKAPWRLSQNYLHDLLTFRLGRLADGALEFRRPTAPRATE